MDIPTKIEIGIYYFSLLFKSFGELCKKLLCIFTGVHYYGDPNKSKEKGMIKPMSEIPGPLSLPFFGTLLTGSGFTNKNVLQVIESNKKMYGNIVKHAFYKNVPIVSILSGKDIEKLVHVLNTDRPPMEVIAYYRIQNFDRFCTIGLVNSMGKEWEKMNENFCHNIRSPKFIGRFISEQNEMANDFVRLLDTVYEENPVVEDFIPLLNDFVAESAFLLVFGERKGFINKDSDIPEHISIFSLIYEPYWQAFHSAGLSPWWKYIPSSTYTNFARHEETIHRFVENMIEEAKAEDKIGGLLEGILRVRGYNDEVKTVVTMELLVGATEPVSKGNVAKKVHEELMEKMLSWDSYVEATDLPYLRACVMEVMRFRPPTPNVARITKDEMVVGGYRIPKHTTIILESWAACLDDENFYRAKEFIPERWIANSEGKLPYSPHRRNMMLTFGFGRRSCPGQRDGLQKLHILLAKILRKYRIHFPQEIKLVKDWLLSPKDRKIPVHLELIE